MSPPRALALVAACAVFAPGCRTPTAITLEISTDVPCDKIRGTQIAVGSPGDVEGKDGAAVTTSCKNGYVGSLVVVPSGDKTSEVGVRVVTGVDRPPEECAAVGYAGCIVARRAIHFIPHTELTLPIAMRQVCVGDPCDPRSTCVEGSCVSSSVPACSGRCELGPVVPPATDAGADAAVSVPHAHVAPGGQHTCVLGTNGRVRCAGKNANGAFGNGTTGAAEPTSDAFVGIDDAVLLAAGYDFTCVARADGTVACAGRNNTAELGNGQTSTESATPSPVVGLAGVKKLAVSANDGGQPAHACAIAADGLRCWGANNLGQIAAGAPDPVLTPMLVPAGNGARDVATGSQHTCIVTASGNVSCWGCRPTATTTFGCISEDGFGGTATAPELVPGLDGVVEIAAGGLQTCALRTDGTVWCFGTNANGQLGRQAMLGMTDAMPAAVPGIADAVHVRASYGATCVLHASGAVTCFGRNEVGECGNASVSPTCAPSAVVGITDAVDLGVGFLNACVVRAGGAIVCWGRNTDGETTGVPPASVQTYASPAPFLP